MLVTRAAGAYTAAPPLEAFAEMPARARRGELFEEKARRSAAASPASRVRLAQQRWRAAARPRRTSAPPRVAQRTRLAAAQRGR